MTDIRLRNFRSYTEACLNGLASSFVVLTGENGAGKTNVLEAVSLFSPGKGMRNADLSDFQNKNQSDPVWAISATIITQYGEIRAGTGRDPYKEKRVVHIQGEVAKNQAQLAEYITCLWLTPQMDRLFIEAASSRRKFLDRMVFNFDTGHAGRVTRYENAMAQRSRLLKEGKAEPVWLDALEIQMAEAGVAVAAARALFVERLQSVCLTRGNAEFPVAKLALIGRLESDIQKKAALEIEDAFRHLLKNSRDEDAVYGGAAQGPHKTDFQVTYRAKNMPAAQCSTGEQKALLIGLVLAHADLIRMERGAPPILLLDEVAAHLDPHRRAVLYDLLSGIGGQVWMTGTDKILFEALGGKGTHLEIPSSLRGA
ncbi:MAG TPA: DNA replication/repair protein RecF [Rhodospirillaceae bacterium]|nr:DNA replication/repair protein RecF [Rhodospirillaceae bacterium]